MKKPKILFITNSSASRLWRIDPVCAYLENVKGFETQKMESQKFVPEAMEGFDIAVLQMVFDRRVYRVAKKHNVKIVFEADDLMEWVPRDHYAKADMNIKRTFYARYAVQQADMVTVTNNDLKQHYDTYRFGKRKADILPNYLDLSYWAKPHNPNTTDRIRIGYAGGLSHVKDLSMIVSPLNKILKEHEKAFFINVGTGGKTETDPIKKALTMDLFQAIPQSRREYVYGARMYEWAKRLNTLQLDIGLAPLLNNKFTRCKTPIKWMEYAINRIPCCASRFMYGTVIEEGVTGYTARTSDEWYEKINILASDKAKREEMGENAYQDVINNYDIGKHLHKWYDLYSTLL